MNEKNSNKFPGRVLLAITLLAGSCVNPSTVQEPIVQEPNTQSNPEGSKGSAQEAPEQQPGRTEAKPASESPATKKQAKTSVKKSTPVKETKAPESIPPSPIKIAAPIVVPTKTACGAALPPSNFSRQDVYRNRPFQPGESAQYEVSYLGIHAGYGNIDVEFPIKYDGEWHQSFSGDASTGEWYEKIFIVKDKIRAISRPWDFGAAQFYIEQDEGSLFGRRYRQKKWIHYSHDTCKAFEKTEDRDKKIKNTEQLLEPGADDAFSAYFDLRTRTFSEGQTERIMVYTSEKNWYLDAKALGTETITVPAGTFKAVKLELKTFLGQELQQKGEVFIWIATDHPARPMIKVEAEIKIGRISIVLSKFKAGRF